MLPKTHNKNKRNFITKVKCQISYQFPELSKILLLLYQRIRQIQNEEWIYWVHWCKIISLYFLCGFTKASFFEYSVNLAKHTTTFLIYNSFSGALKSSCLSIYLFMMIFNTFCLLPSGISFYNLLVSTMNQQWLALKAVQYLSHQCVDCLREEAKENNDFNLKSR